MNALLSAGVIFFAYSIGRWALDGCLASGLRRSALARHVLALILGIAILTPPLVVLAGAGLFRARELGAISWIGGVVTLLRRPRQPAPRPSFDLPDLLALIAAIAFAFAAASGRDETLVAGRDQQIYAESAVALAERGQASARYSHLDDADRALLRSLGGVRVPGLTEGRNGIDQAIATTHPLGWPVWLAVAYSTFGIDGLYAANAVVFAFGSLLFFVLLRRLVAPEIAVVATCLLLVLPSSIWISGISLSEPLAMAFLLAVPLLGAAGIHRSRWRIAALLFAATLARIDSALLVLASITAAMLVFVTVPTRKTTAAARQFALIQVAGLLGALLIYLVLFLGYLRSVLQETASIAAASLAVAMLIVVFAPDRLTGLRQAIAARPSRAIAIAVLIGLFTYAAAIRPTLRPFHIIQQGSGLDGQRDYREESLLNLAVYVSWPILLFALAGVCYAIQQNWAGRRGAFRSLLLLIGIGPVLLYLWSPQVSPDHPWALRRFVPTIVPYVVLFAALFVQVLTRRLGRIGRAAGAIALVAPYSLVASAFPLQQAVFRENHGTTNRLVAIAKELPEELIVAIGADDKVSSALFIAYGKPVAIVAGGFQNKSNIERVTNWVAAKARLGRPAWLLHGPELWRTGAAISDQREWSILRSHMMPSYRAPATEVTTSQSDLILSRIDGLDATFARRMFGGERIWGARDDGFFASEVAPFGEFRYTDGLAWIDVPAIALRDAEALKLDVFSYAPQGTLRWIAVLIDGAPMWTRDVVPGVSTLRVPISGPVQGDTARIEILSQMVGPGELNANDWRTGLGIGLIGIRPLRAGEPRASAATMRGFRSRLTLVGLPHESQRVSTAHPVDFVLDVTNIGTEFWPSVRDLGVAKGAVQIALRWYRRGNRDQFVGDNRWALALSMLPGDRTRVRVPLAPIGLSGAPLAPGEYEVRVGLVRETMALFADNGDAIVSIPAIVDQ